MKYDIIVIGGGPAGYSAAAAAAREGKAVCLFEGDKPGGTCLNVGCIPTKYLLDRAAALEKLRAMTAEEGILRNAGEFSFRAVQRGKTAAVDKLRNGVLGLLRSVGVIIVEGRAELLPDRRVICQGEEYEADHVIIATGSESVKNIFPGSELCIDSTGALALDRVPKRLCVIGGGVIGLELGSAYMSYGAEVEVVETAERLLPGELDAAAELLTRRLTDRGMKINCGTKVKSVERRGEGCAVITDGKIIEADAVLLAVGRRPRLDGIDTEKLGLKTERGAIVVDSHMRTNLPGVYAIGDVTGRYMLAHAAYADADAAVSTIFGKNVPVDLRALPRCIYTLPPFAAVGMTQKQAGERGISTVIGRADYRGNGMAVAEGESGCVFAVIDKVKGTTIGFQIVGAGAPEMVAAATLAVKESYTEDDWTRLIVAHPSLSESLKDAALDGFRRI